MTAQTTSLPVETRTAGRPTSLARSRATSWRVIHACEYARDVLLVAESQVAAGMQPYIVTPQGSGKAELFLSAENPEPRRRLSLLRSWQEVRQWRKSILDCDPENSADVVHAHSFAAGMAAVRNCSCVVYDFLACIEELAASARQCERDSWLARSFRAAEQFVLFRAAAGHRAFHGDEAGRPGAGRVPGKHFPHPQPASRGGRFANLSPAREKIRRSLPPRRRQPPQARRPRARRGHPAAAGKLRLKESASVNE
jgi:hypothetical protein